MFIVPQFHSIQFKTLAERIRDFLPKPSISGSQTVEVEHTNEAFKADDNYGAGETMALEGPENLV